MRKPAKLETPSKVIDPAPYIILAVYLLAIILLTPWKFDFPLNDDWVFTLGVRHLLEEGRIRLCDLGSPTQILQLFWGAIWMKLFGVNLGILKLSTCVAAAVGTLSFCSTLKDLDLSVEARLVAALTLAFSPLYFCLSLTFMTEIPYLCMMLLAFSLYIKAEKHDSNGSLLAGSAAAGGAYLVRQTGMMIPLGYFIFILSQKRLTLKKFLLLWGIPLATISAHGLWFHFIHGPTWASENVVFRRTLNYLLDIKLWTAQALFRSYASSLFLGLCFSPFAFGFLTYSRQFFRKKSAVQIPLAARIALILYILTILIFLISNGWMPQLENTLHKAGLGVITVAGAAHKAAGIFGSEGFWITLTLIGAVSFCLWILALGDLWSSAQSLEKAALFIFLISSLGQFALSFTRDNFFDRYVMVLLPASILVMALLAKRWQWAKPMAYAAAAALALLSWSGTSDYLAWNQAKWTVGNMGVAQGLSPAEIANGFDWDGYHVYEKNMEQLKKVKPLQAIGEWEWQTLTPRKAFTAFQSDLTAYRLIAKAPYWSPLSRKTEYIYLWGM